MWFDGIRQPNTIYVASVSRGKDSTAMLRAIQLMGWPLDAIYSVDIWATQDIPAELPPMVAFKEEWDKKVLEWFGVPVTRLCAMKDGKKVSYNDIFYRKISPKREREREYGCRSLCGNSPIFGFPLVRGGWCKSYLKQSALKVSQVFDALGVRENSRKPHLRIPDSERELVYQLSQERSVHPFPLAPRARRIK